MAKSYKPRRVKLKNHDAGNDRHNKGVAHEMKKKRQSQTHQNVVSTRRSLKRVAQKPAPLTEQTIQDIRYYQMQGASVQELALMFHTTEKVIQGYVA